MGIIDDLKSGILLFDGAMGTMLQQYGMQVGEHPETLNKTDRETIIKIHKEYINAGADVITTNTFQANDLKLPNGYTVEDTIRTGVLLAKQSGAKYVAADIGPLGQMFEPIGTFTFKKAYEMFKKQAIAAEKSGADVILLETFIDLYEAKIAILAAKENTTLPVFCTLTYQEDGRTFMGCDPITQITTLTGLGIDAVGVNCSLGPEQLSGIIDDFLEYSNIPVMLQANAGLPKMRDGKTVYDVSPEQYNDAILPMLEKGLAIIGGCCGTTPEHIKLLNKTRKSIKKCAVKENKFTAVSSGNKTVILDNKITIIGERINPTGKKKLKEALLNAKIDYVLNEAIDQAEAGSDILDVNVGLPDIDEPKTMQKIIKEIQAVTNLPLQIDSADYKTLEAGVRIYNGKPLINSVNGKQESLDTVLPIVKKYGAAVIGLTLDESGIPKTAEERFNVAKKILYRAMAYGIPKEDIIIDCLALTASAQQEQVLETIKAVTMVKQRLGLKTALGVSNVSFGLPNRPLINATFLAAAIGAGLDAAIINPLSKDYMQVIDIYKVLNGQDKQAKNFIKNYSKIQSETIKIPVTQQDLITLINQGRKEMVPQKIAEMLNQGIEPLDIVNNYFSKALNIIGYKFAKQEIFLPQLMQSAETVQAGFTVIKDHVDKSGKPQESKGKVIMATVKGDIHDIGKNIVAMILKNYGYDVFDLGKDVSPETIIETAKTHKTGLIGLSALMTTTVGNMKETIAQIKAANIDAKIMVGGAVLNEEYTEFVNADYYAKDALESVKIAKKVFGK